MTGSESAGPSGLELLRRVELALNERGSPNAPLSSVLRLLLPSVCQQGVLELDELDGSTSIVTAFVDPELERLALDVTRRYPPKPTVHPAEVAARTGETRLIDVTEGLMASIAHDAEHLALLRQFGATQLLVMPLRREGRTLGVLALSTAQGKRFDEESRLLAELVAARLTTHLDSTYFRRRVLLVEVDGAQRALLTRALELAGFDVCVAGTGADALRVARERRPAVVVLDVHSPGRLGVEVCEQLASDALTAALPVIQLSAVFSSSTDRPRARTSGSDGSREPSTLPGDREAMVNSLSSFFEERWETRRSIERERLARVELERANARLRAITESGLLGTFEWGSDGVIVDANDRFLSVVGRSREELLSRRLSLQELLAGPLAASDARAPLVAERELIAKDGRRVSVLFGMAQIPELPDRGVAFVLDVSEQRRRAELEALLLGIVSHDLRNPLGVVTMAASLLLAQELTEAQRKLANRIEVAGRKSARLIGDLLDFTVARGSGIQLSPEPGDLHDVVAQAVDDLHATWPGRAIVHERVGEAVSYLDQARVEQIAANLIGNALQHSPATSPVHIETKGDVESVSFSVQNEGRPIPGELIAQLFAPLRRGENAGHRRGSIGLGLFIVHHLVEAHGGSIEVRSSEADGTRFTVRLPRQRPAASLAAPPLEPATFPA